MKQHTRLFGLMTLIVLASVTIMGASNLTSDQILNSVYNSTDHTIQIGVSLDTMKDSTALTNAATFPLNLEHETSGTPAAGIGVGAKFTQQITAGATLVAKIAAVMTDVSATHDADMVTYLAKAGAAPTEAFRITSTGVVSLINGETIDNSTNGTVTYTTPIEAHVNSTSSTVTAPIEQHTNVTSHTVTSPLIGLDGAVTVNDSSADVDFRVESNGSQYALVVNAGDDRVGVFTAAPTVPLDVTGESLFTGAMTIEGGEFSFNPSVGAYNYTVIAPVEAHTNSTSSTVTAPIEQHTNTTSFTVSSPILAAVQGTTGGWSIRAYEATTGALSGGTGSCAVNVPSGALLIGSQLRVDTAITSGDGGTTWGAIYATGSTATIAANTTSFNKDTKVSTFFNANAATAITTGTTTITVAPNAGTFSGGVIRCISYAMVFTAMAAAP